MPKKPLQKKTSKVAPKHSAAIAHPQAEMHTQTQATVTQNITHSQSPRITLRVQANPASQKRFIPRQLPPLNIPLDIGTDQIITKTHTFAQEFVAFIKGFGVIGLALGVVIGGATNTLVASLSTNIISPLIGYALPGNTLTDWKLGQVGVGAFLDSAINFVILMLIIWLAVKLFVARLLTDKEKEKIGIL